MKEKRLDPSYIEDIKKAATLAIDFAKGLTRESFEKAFMAQSAILYQLAIIGEASTHISSEFRKAHPDFEWKKMSGMRNILVHAYHELDLDIIWLSVQKDLPELLRKIEKI